MLRNGSGGGGGGGGGGDGGGGGGRSAFFYAGIAPSIKGFILETSKMSFRCTRCLFLHLFAR